MKTNGLMRSRKVARLLSIIVICSLFPNGMAFGALQPPLSRVTNPVFGTTGGVVPAAVPAHLAPYIKPNGMTAAIQLGKALFWDMQVGSDGVTACASCHYRAGADPVVGTASTTNVTAIDAKRDRNQLNPGPDTLFGNNSTVIQNFNPLAPLDPATLKPVPVPLRAAGYTPRFAPNYLLLAADFPLFNVQPPLSRLVIDPLTGVIADSVSTLNDTNDIVGSQGIRLAQFTGIDPNANNSVDLSTPLTDSLFFITVPAPGNNIRQVTGRNTPPVVNAVFNYANFWDGRANNLFNGVNPFGPLDQSAMIWRNTTGTVGGSPVQQQIAIPNSSLASQAVGPPLSPVEMSFSGRTFPELGRKMIARAPLFNQLVHPNDSVLGTLSRATLVNGTVTGNKGINVPAVPGVPGNTYQSMIQTAFVDDLWNGGSVNTPNGVFTHMEANFSLFWGLAIQLYEATLVSDRAPFDRFQAGNKNALTLTAQAGFTTFDSKCTICHTGSEFSSAVVGSNLPNCVLPDCNPPAFTSNTNHNLIKQDVNPATFADPKLIDAGFFNIGVRPTADDPGRGGSAPSGLPLSFTRLATQLGLPFATPSLPLSLPEKVQGSFKTPILRNVELTAPYFHNGGVLTLDQVVEFYSRGGNFPNNPELAAAIQPIGNMRQNATRRAEVVEFLKTLTDDRVRNEQAPFDHPELVIHNGVDPVLGAAIDSSVTLAPTGGGPVAVPPVTFTMNPMTTPTNLVNMLLSGTVDDTATVAIDVTNTTTNVKMPTAFAAVGGTVAGLAGGTVQAPTDWSINLTGLTPGSNAITVTATSITGGIKSPPDPPVVSDPPLNMTILVTPTATISGTPTREGTKLTSATLIIGGAGVVSYQFSVDGGLFSADIPVATPISLSGLTDGTHTVAVIGKDVGGNQQPPDKATTDSWIVKAAPPALALNPVPSLTKKRSLTISGTVLQGSLSAVTVDTGAKATLVQSLSGGNSTWSCEITGLTKGVNNITLTAQDTVFNSASKSAAITVVVPDGNLKGTGNVDISDALKALRIAIGLVSPTFDDLMRGDVAPLVNGVPAPDDKIDLADAIVILKRVAGLVTF